MAIDINNYYFRTLIEGDKEAGFSIFWADDGLDTGPILLQKSCPVDKNDTLDSLYNNFLYPEGIKAMGEAVNLVASGKAPKIPQSSEGATYDPLLNKEELQRIDWNKKTAEQVHNFIRALDSTPGAWTLLNGEKVRFYGSKLWDEGKLDGDVVDVDGKPGIVHDNGLLIAAADGKYVNVEKLKIGNKTILASKYGKASESASIEFTEEEKIHVESIRLIWKSILNVEVDNDTDFFACGKYRTFGYL